jgi:hypothetical protein
LGIFIFFVIVVLVVWFVYSGMQRQNARFGTVAQVTRVPDARLAQWQAQTVSAEPIEPVPLYLNLQQSFNGEHDKVVQTLNDVADMLQKEVEVRAFPDGHAANAAPVDHETYRNLVFQQSNRLMVMFQDAEIGFEQASSPTGGTPEMLRQAYAAFLDQLVMAARTFSSTEAPSAYAQTQATYREYLRRFYEQVAEWPNTLRQASKNVTGKSSNVVLSAVYDIGPLQHAISTESNRG